MADGILEKYGEKLGIWIDENPIIFLFGGLATSAISYSLIGNFIVHTESWLSSPLKLGLGAITIVMGFYATLTANRALRLVTDSDEEYTFTEEIIGALLLYPALPVYLFKRWFGGDSE